MLIDLLRTTQTYKTRENAIKALERATAAAGYTDADRIPYLIVVNAEGRFAPAVVGVQYLHLVHHGITVVG